VRCALVSSKVIVVNAVSESGAFQEGSEPWITVGASVRMMMFYGFGLRRVSLKLFSSCFLSFLFILCLGLASAQSKID
jgi:hypothetical protein